MKGGEGISQRTYIHNPKRQQCGDGQREGGWWGLGEDGQRVGAMGIFVIVSTVKVKNE